MAVTRRELCSMLPAVLIPAIVPAEAIAEQDKSAMPSAMFPLDKMPVRTPNNAEIRDVLKGKLATGESLEVHQTTLAPGGAPHPPHRHPHSEMWLIREGTVEITVNGTNYRLGPGSGGFVGEKNEHGQKNMGTTSETQLWWDASRPTSRD